MKKHYTLQSLRAEIERLEAGARELSWTQWQEEAGIKRLQRQEALVLHGQSFFMGGFVLSLFMPTDRRGFALLACAAAFIILGYLHQRVTAAAVAQGNSYEVKYQELVERHQTLLANGMGDGLQLLIQDSEDGGKDLWLLDSEAVNGRYYLGHLAPGEPLEGHRQALAEDDALQEIESLNKLFAAAAWEEAPKEAPAKRPGFASFPQKKHMKREL